MLQGFYISMDVCGEEDDCEAEQDAGEGSREEEQRVAEVWDAAGGTVILSRVGVVLDIEHLVLDGF